MAAFSPVEDILFAWLTLRPLDFGVHPLSNLTLSDTSVSNSTLAVRASFLIATPIVREHTPDGHAAIPVPRPDRRTFPLHSLEPEPEHPPHTTISYSPNSITSRPYCSPYATNATTTQPLGLLHTTAPRHQISTPTFTMKIFQQDTEFDYTWEEVSISKWQQYGPWNEKTPHVVAVDTLSRTIDPATGIVSLSDSRITCKTPI
jgi:hypothetical protein